MPTQSVRELADWYWSGLLTAHPLMATYVGDPTHDDRMPDLSESARADELSLHHEALARAARFDSASVPDGDRLELEVISSIAKRESEALESRFDLLVAGSQMGATWRVSPGAALALVASLQQAATRAAVDRYIRRLRDFPRFMDETADLLRDAEHVGRAQSRAVLTRTLGQVKRVLATPAAESTALAPVAEAGDDAKNAVIQALQENVYPAYAKIGEQLEASLGRARDVLGLCALDHGDELYATAIRYSTTIDATAETIHRRGQADLEKVQADRRQTAASLGFDSPQAAADAFIAGELGPTSADELLERARQLVERSWELSKSAFGRMPAQNCMVKLVDPSRAADVLAYYEGATANRPPVFFVSPVDIASRPTNRLPAWVAHEANPGHHLQIALENAATDRSDLRRFTTDIASSAFVEGWGLYAERLADELGLYSDDWERLGMLDSQAFRCARLVVDTGIHAFGWSRDEAIDFMIDAGSPRTEAEIEVDRYAADPGQALTYRLGQIAIEECRRHLTVAGQMTVKQFHDRVLELGSLPLPTLQRELVGTEFELG